jgi:hypothetical protein
LRSANCGEISAGKIRSGHGASNVINRFVSLVVEYLAPLDELRAGFYGELQ